MGQSVDLSEALHVGDDRPYQSHELLKRWDEWQDRARSSDMEHYVDRNLDLLFVYSAGQTWEANAVPNDWVQAPDHVAPALTYGHGALNGCGKVGRKAAEVARINATVVCRRNQGAVLVRGIPVVEQIEQLVPTRFTVRFQADDEGKELWGNPVGQSVFHSFLKPCRSLGKGKLDRLSAPVIRDQGGDDLPIGVVKGRSEGLQRVAADQGSLIYDGFVLFSVGGTLVGFCVCFEDVSEGLLFAQQFVELSDVFRGPVNLEMGSFQ